MLNQRMSGGQANRNVFVQLIVFEALGSISVEPIAPRAFGCRRPGPLVLCHVTLLPRVAPPQGLLRSAPRLDGVGAFVKIRRMRACAKKVPSFCPKKRLGTLFGGALAEGREGRE